MATITLSFTGMVDGASTTISSSGNLDDSFVPYFFSYYRDKYKMGPQPDGSYTLKTDAELFPQIAKEIADTQSGQVQNFVVQQRIAELQASLPSIAVIPNG